MRATPAECRCATKKGIQVQIQNVKEYSAIRGELTTLKNCVTNYVGFVIAGSAAAFYGLAGKDTAAASGRWEVAITSVLLAIVSALVLLLLSYKFKSHNRYAGYSKLLTHERFERHDLPATPLFCWEICVDRLRRSELDWNQRRHLLDYCCREGIPGLAELPRKLDALLPSAKQPRGLRLWWKWVKNGWRGFRLLVGLDVELGESWHYPLYVARIFCAINTIYLIFAFRYEWRAFLIFAGSYEWRQLKHVVLLLSVLALVTIWAKFLTDLTYLMKESETVDAYCWKFVPFRAEFLRSLFTDVGYRLVGVGTVGIISADTQPVPPLETAGAAPLLPTTELAKPR
jgi:hypothetical protein